MTDEIGKLTETITILKKTTFDPSHWNEGSEGGRGSGKELFEKGLKFVCGERERERKGWIKGKRQTGNDNERKGKKMEFNKITKINLKIRGWGPPGEGYFRQNGAVS